MYQLETTLPLTFPEEKGYRTKFEIYQDMLYALFLFHNLSFYQLVGIAHLTQSKFKKLVDFAKESKHIEEKRTAKGHRYNLTEEGTRCSNCWRYLKKRIDIADLTSSVLPYVETELKNEGCFSEELKLAEFPKRRGFMFYLSFLTTLMKSPEPLCVTEMMKKEHTDFSKINRLKKTAISKGHIEVRSEGNRDNLLLTEKGEECVELFSRYVTRFDLQPILNL